MSAQLSTTHGDLRRDATEVKRDRDHNSKWALGMRRTGRWMENGAPELSPRPQLPYYKGHYDRTTNQNAINRKGADAKFHLRHDVSDIMTYDEHHFSASGIDQVPPLLGDMDPNIFYSFDAPTGPTAGRDVLGVAVARAVKKFETKETEKLVREYEFVAYEDDTNHSDGSIADDDYEFIDRSHL
ncbi:hypothetical protein FQN50_004712 [Emmonsiellopsis sp. PD_5]|nr:hypothetical protein FQN50_004712 [Emmonsiellopsis sp. PD_5]